MFSRDAIVTALGHWERARVLFNVVLFAYVLARFGGALSAIPHRLWPEIITLAVAANIIYCIAYPIDLVTTATIYRHIWKTAGRPALWIALLIINVAVVHSALAHLLLGT